MPTNNVKTWLDCALQQMAAESYLDQFMVQGVPLQQVLIDGNNDRRVISLDQFTGKTQFTDLQAQQFAQRYQIVDHHVNDATGLSATLMRERDQNGVLTNNYTLSFRSVEYRDQTEGGDWERDGRDGAAGEIATQGFAFGQLVSMERYYRELKASLKLPENAVLNVTGYSLGGHLATVFTELHAEEVQHTYTFNGAGRGHISGGTAGLSEAERIREMLDLLEFNLLQLDPEGFMFRSGSGGSVQTDARYQAALLATKEIYTTTISAFPPGEIGNGEAFQKITQFFGHSTSGFDTELVANSGVHGSVTTVLIEGQPLVENPRELEFGNSHSITLMVDSLALQDLFLTIDPMLTQAQIENIFKATSDAKAGLIGQTHIAEGDTLELALDALRKVFVGPQAPTTDFNDNAGGFGDLTFRNQFYANLQSVKDALNGQTFEIVPLVDLPTDTLKGNALLPGETGTAYRYAVKNLNPFAVLGADYAQFSNPGDYDLYDSTTGNGAITLEYLKDRATLLANKLSVNTSTVPSITGAAISASSWTYYRDNQSSYEIGSSAVSMDQMIFGNATDESIDGSLIWGDRLYGGDGADTIYGKGGDDYIEGNEGNDALLSGGDGTDIILGGQGDDLLDGGTGNDILNGGLDTDTLRGGDGLDTYIIRAVDGADTIEDSDGKGVINFVGYVLGGALQREGDSAGAYRSADGTITFLKSGNDLVVTGSGPLTIKNYTPGKFGIRLMALPTIAVATRTEFLKVDHYQQVGNNPDGTPIYDPVYAPFFDDLSNDTRNTSPIGGLVPAIDDLSNLIYAGGGSDFIFSGSGDDQIYGEGDDDEIYGGLGNDRLFGGGGNDQLLGDNVAVSTDGGNDYLDGGDGSDFVQGGAGRDIVLGGAGNDLLNGDEFAGDNSGVYDDWLDGGGGDDDLQGGAGSDVLIGGADNDFLVGDRTQFQNGTPEAGGNDSLDGGAGNDQLFGVYGDDVLSGGTGHDLVNGQDGSDVLYGGDGNDTLSGDLRLTSLTGGYDTREWRAAGGDDLLFGEVGADLLSGGEGNDVIDGGSEDDKLYGDYITSQVSTSDPLYWTLFSAPGDDWLTGGAGNDALSGGFGVDVLKGGEGVDSLLGGAGDDLLEGGAGDDVLYGEYSFAASEFLFNPFFSTIKALSGNDVLDGGDGSDELHGGEGSDVLLGGVGNDHLIDDESGYSVARGNDVLNGGDGDDVLESWMGDDELRGGAGNDRLTSHAGHDILYGDDGDDFLSSGEEPPFSEGGGPISATGDSTLIGGLGNDAYEIDGPGDVVVEAMGEGTDTVNSFVSYTLPDAVENLNLAGLALTGVGNNLNNVLTGGNWLEGLEGDDTLIGKGRLDGGTGNDVLQGGTGSVGFSPEDGLLHVVANTYVFGADYGQDTIQENDPTFNSVYYSNEDTLFFTSGISPSDVVWERSGHDLLLTVNGGPDRITIPSFYNLHFDRGGYLVNGLTAPPQGIVSSSNGGFPTYIAPSRIELVQFGDGTVWHADHFGAPLLGDFRADTYDFGRSSGELTIIDFDFSQSSTFREPDTIRVGVSPEDLTVSRLNGDDLALTIQGTADSLTIQSFFKIVTVIPPFSFSGYSVAPYQIEQVQFANGTLWMVSDLTNRISSFIGTSGADILFGNQNDNLLQGLTGDDYLSGQGGNDAMDGAAGNDRLFGDDGTDTLTGGLGSDMLRGGAGDDVYVFNLGDGFDTIEDIALTGESNRIQFGAGIGQSDVTFTRDEDARTLTIQVGSSGTDQLLLTNFDPTCANGSLVVSAVGFADGSFVDLAELFPSNQAPTIAVPLADQTVSEDAPFTLVVPSSTFADQDANDVLTLSASLVDGTALPAWLSFDAETATFSGTPDDAQVGSLDLKVTAIDQEHASVSDVFMLTVTNVNEIPTVAALLADQAALEDSAFSFTVPTSTFTDLDQVHGDTLVYSAMLTNSSAFPSWLSFDQSTRTFGGNPLNDDVGALAITVTATDQGGLSTSTGFTLAVQNVNDAPAVVNPIADQVAWEDSAFTVSIPATAFRDEDLIHGDVLTYDATLADGSSLPSWLNFDATSQTFSGLPGAGDAGSLQIAVTVTDSEEQAATDLFTLTVSGPLPQVITGTAGNDALTGGRGNDTLTGFAGNDLLDGGIGSDTMIGGSGNDLYVVDSSSDAVTELANQGFDTVFSAATVTLSPNVELLVLTNADAIAGTGNNLSNGLTGNNAANMLDGGAGADVMVGLGGDDTYIVDNSSDVVVELVNQGNDTVRSSITYTLGDNVENLTLTGSNTINGSGNSLDNVLIGNSVSNTLTGGAGNDTYVVGTGDTVVESNNGGTDTVQSAIPWTLGSNFENLALSGISAINGTGNGAANDLTGNSANNMLTGAGGSDTLRGGLGNDTLNGGNGNDKYLFGRGDGQDLVQDNNGSGDKILYDAGINPLDLVISRQANDLRLSIHGSTDYVTVQNWYTSSSNRTETIQAGDGEILLSTQVDQLIQAMASFSQQTGLTWDQAVDQRPQEVETILAASWQ